jgi:hypothetical protein
MWNRKDPFRVLIKDEDGVLKAMTLKEKTSGVIDDSQTNLDLRPVSNSKLQLFRQGEDANVIVSVVHSGYVWDGTWIRENQLFYCSGKHGCWNQRFCCRGFIHEGAELWHLFCVSFPSMVVTWMADERKFQMRSQHVDLNSRQTFQIKFDGS